MHRGASRCCCCLPRRQGACYLLCSGARPGNQASKNVRKHGGGLPLKDGSRHKTAIKNIQAEASCTHIPLLPHPPSPPSTSRQLPPTDHVAYLIYVHLPTDKEQHTNKTTPRTHSRQDTTYQPLCAWFLDRYLLRSTDKICFFFQDPR